MAKFHLADNGREILDLLTSERVGFYPAPRLTGLATTCPKGLYCIATAHPQDACCAADAAQYHQHSTQDVHRRVTIAQRMAVSRTWTCVTTIDMSSETLQALLQ